MIKYAIIGGTGVYDAKMLNKVREELVETEYGSVVVKIGEFAGKEVAFLARHGSKHSTPPHLVNYRANIKALAQLGVEKILATAAVGSLNPAMAPGDFVLVTQFMDFTKNRPVTFFEGGEQGVLHIDMTEPYCGEIRKVLKEAGKEVGIRITEGGNYVCTEGPRFETPAEISMYKMLGGDLVGMTSCPEVVLARESAICYATVAMITNFAAGISPTNLTHAEVVETMANNRENFKALVMKYLELVTAERLCVCKDALAELGQF